MMGGHSQLISEQEILRNRALFAAKQEQFLDLLSPERCDQIYRNFELLDQERSNWLLAIQLADWMNATRISLGLYEYLYARGFLEEIENIWTNLQDTSPNDSNYNQHKAMLLHQLGTILLDQGRQNDAIKHLTRSLELAQLVDWTQLQANTLYQLGVNYINQGQYKNAKEVLFEALALSGKTNEPRSTLYINGQLANILMLEGEYEKAVAILNENMQRWQEMENPTDQLLAHTTLHVLGKIRLHQGFFEEARSLLERSLEFKQQLDSGLMAISRTKCLLADACIELGDWSGAEKHLKDSIQTSFRIKDYMYLATAYRTLAKLHYKQMNRQRANTTLIQAITEAQRSQNPRVKFEVGICCVRIGMRTLNLRSVFSGVRLLANALQEMDISFSVYLRMMRNDLKI